MKTFYLSILLLFSCFSLFSQSIRITNVRSQGIDDNSFLCSGKRLYLSYATAGNFNADNKFQLEYRVGNSDLNWKVIAFKDSSNIMLADLPSYETLKVLGESSSINFRIKSTSPFSISNQTYAVLAGDAKVELLGISKNQAYPTEPIAIDLSHFGYNNLNLTLNNGQIFNINGSYIFENTPKKITINALRSDSIYIKEVYGGCGVGSSTGKFYLNVSDQYVRILSALNVACTNHTFRIKIQKSGTWNAGNQFYIRLVEQIYPSINPKSYDVLATEKDGYLEAVLPTSIPAKSYSIQIVTTSPSVVSNIYSEILRLYPSPMLTFKSKDVTILYGNDVSLEYASNGALPSKLKLNTGESFNFSFYNTTNWIYFKPKSSGYCKIDSFTTVCGNHKAGLDSIKITMAPSIITDSISVSEVCAGGSFEVKFKSNINLKIGEKIYAGRNDGYSGSDNFRIEGVVVANNRARFVLPSNFTMLEYASYYLQLWTESTPSSNIMSPNMIKFKRMPTPKILFTGTPISALPQNVHLVFMLNGGDPMTLKLSNGDVLSSLPGGYYTKKYYVAKSQTLSILSAENSCGVNSNLDTKIDFTVQNEEKSIILKLDVPDNQVICAGTTVNMTLQTSGNFESGTKFMVDLVNYDNSTIFKENLAELVDGKAAWKVPDLSDIRGGYLRVRNSSSTIMSNNIPITVQAIPTYSSSKKGGVVLSQGSFENPINFYAAGGAPYLIKSKEGPQYVIPSDGYSTLPTYLTKSKTVSLTEISNQCGTSTISEQDYTVYVKDKTLSSISYYQTQTFCKGSTIKLPIQVLNLLNPYETHFKLKLDVVSISGSESIRRNLLSNISSDIINFSIPTDLPLGSYAIELSDVENLANESLKIYFNYVEAPSPSNLKLSISNTFPIKVGERVTFIYTNTTGESLNLQLNGGNSVYNGFLYMGTSSYDLYPSQSATFTSVKAINQCGLSEIPVNLSVTVKPVIFWNYLKGSTYCRDEKVSININAQGVFSNKKLNLVIKDGYTAKEYNVLSVTDNGQYSFTIPKDLTTGDHYIELRSSAGEAEASVNFLFLKEKPVVSVVGSATINTGQTTYLKVISSSLGKYFGRDFSSDLLNYTLSDGSSNTMSFSGNNNYVLIPVSPKASTTLTFASVSNLCGVGTVTGSAQIIVNPVSAKSVEITSLENQETIQYYNYACGNQTIKVNFKLTGNYDTGTIYDLYMSDSVGNNFVKIPVISQTSNTLSATLPEVAATGFGYRFKVVANTSNSTSTTSPFPITIHKIPTAQFDSTNVYVIPGQTPTLTISTIGALPIKLLLKDDNAVFYNYTTTTPKISIPVSAPMGTKFLIGSVSNNLCAGRVGSKSQAQLLIVTGIEELSDWGIRVAPNPTEGALTLLNVVKDARLNIYDSLGKLVLEKALSQGDNLIDIGLQPSGIYFFSVESSTKKVVLKVQKY